MRNYIYKTTLILLIFNFQFIGFYAMAAGKSCFQKGEYFNVLDRDIIPDENVARKVAEAVLIPMYGIDAIEKQKPFSVALENDVWVVNGYLSENMLGGVFSIKISRKDGRVLNVIHGK